MAHSDHRRARDAVALLAALLVALAGATEAARASDNGAEESGGLLWQGEAPTMTVEALAACAGPVLWFSHDEPLLVNPPTPVLLPEPFPFQPEVAAPVVYYRLREIGVH